MDLHVPRSGEPLRFRQPDGGLVDRDGSETLLGEKDGVASFAFREAEHVAATPNLRAVLAQGFISLGPVVVVRGAVSFIP